MKYDYLIVGSGLFGAVFAYEMTKKGKKCLVIEKRNHIGGNVYTENEKGINVHKYGAHIFHTDNKEIWEYINQFADFNRYTNSPVANFKGELYNLPFNMNTFYQMWNVKTPDEAKAKIEAQKKEANITNPQNLEEQAISLVGRDIYEKLVKGYTEKQWGRKCKDLPAFIIKRLPVRFTFDNNYFNDLFQGIPIGGYTKIIEKMLEGVDVKLNTDFFDDKEKWLNIANKVIFTGMIDQYYDYCYGELEYRGLTFEFETLEDGLIPMSFSSDLHVSLPIFSSYGATGSSYFYDADPTDNAIQLVETRTYESDGESEISLVGRMLTANFSDLTYYEADGSSTVVAPGSWKLSFPLNYEDTTRALAAGQTIEVNGMPATIEQLSISPIALHVTYVVDRKVAWTSTESGRLSDHDSKLMDSLLGIEVSVTMKDGTTLEMTHSIGGSIGDGDVAVCETGVFWNRILDLDKVASITVGGAIIEL